MNTTTRQGDFCPLFHHAVELIGRRWTGAIIRALLAGKSRFSDLRSSVPDLSDRMLSERLKELEREGVVERTVIPETPVRIDYRLTNKGKALTNVMTAISTWANDWVTPEDLERHAVQHDSHCDAGDALEHERAVVRQAMAESSALKSH